MKILFIYPDLNIDVNWGGHYQEGIATLSAVLKANGHQVELMHIINLNNSVDISNLGGFDLIAFSATTPMFPFVRHYSLKIKEKYKDIPILCGGPHVTSVPAETLRNAGIDYVCVGEGEDFILDFLDFLRGSKDKKNIKNLGYKIDNGEAVINDLRPPVNIDELPFPDRTIFNSIIMKSDFIAISGGRGCPFSCSYCGNYQLNKMYSNKYLRLRDPNIMINEVEALLKIYPHIKKVTFGPDTFTSDRQWLSTLLSIYARRIGLPFTAFTHPSTVTDEKIKLMKEAGCERTSFGIQSGNESVRKNIMLRNVSNEKILESVKILKKYNINFGVDIMFGVPGENKSQMLDTIKMCAENELKVKSHIYYPLPGTKMEEVAIARGLFDKNTYGEDYHSRTILNYSTIEKKTILFFHRYSKHLVRIYNIPGKRYYILDKLLCGKATIWLIMTLRSSLISLRSVIRGIAGIREYKQNRMC